jgi:UDP-N-acetylmuramoyl-tripeptide--D-alanyl-D-alanine ligase
MARRKDALFHIPEILRATGGTLVRGRDDVTVFGVSIDSRKTAPGDLFVPLRGERVDGHDFLPAAAAAGACATLVSGAFAHAHGAELAALAAERHLCVVAVEDPLEALQELARHHLTRFPDLVSVGITGSNGKTTTKEMVGAILQQFAPTAVSPGNLNSEIGLPLAAFGVTQDHRFAVFEMGINNPGEMDLLASIVKPDVALITNIGTAHIGLLGSKKGIALEKKRIFSRFTGGETGFIYEQEPLFDVLARDVRGTIRTFGETSTTGFRGAEDLGLDGFAVNWEELTIRVPLTGGFNIRNALAAISVALHLGAPPAAVRDGLQSVRPMFGRGEILRGPVTVVQDCYNANPESVFGILDTVDAIPWEGRKVVVIGAMKELGSAADESHRAVGDRAARSQASALFFYGAEAHAAFQAAQAEGYDGHLVWTDDYADLAARVQAYLVQGDLLLVKGSRSLELERLGGAVTEQRAASGHA